MGQSCTRSSGGVADDNHDESKGGKRFFHKKSKSSKNGHADANTASTSQNHKAMTPRTSERLERSTLSAGPCTVVSTIEALQHTMRPTVSVVGSNDLHPEFRQFTSIFARGNSALAVVSCEDAKYPQQVLTAGEDCGIALLNYETGHVMRRWVRAHNAEVNALTRPSDTGVFASCGRDNNAKIWNLNRDDPIVLLEGHTMNVSSVDVDLKSALVVTGSDDSTLRIWDVARGSEIVCSDVPKSQTTFVRFLPELNLVAQGGDDLALRLWDWRMPPHSPALSLANSLEDTGYVPVCCDASPSVFSRLLTGHSGSAGGSGGSFVQEWDVRKAYSVRIYTGHTRSVNCLRFSRSNMFGDTTFFTASDDGTMGFWSMEPPSSNLDVSKLPISHQFRVPEGAITCFECNGSGDIIAMLRGGSGVVFRPERQGDTILPAKRFRYIGAMNESKSLAAAA